MSADCDAPVDAKAGVPAVPTAADAATVTKKSRRFIDIPDSEKYVRLAAAMV
jgi:hypothetical protein